MKDSRNGWIGVGLILVLFLLAGSTYGLLTGRLPFAKDDSTRSVPETAVEMAKARVKVGESRDSALSSLSDAWFHSECRLTATAPIDDLFFYGSNEPDEVQVIFVKSQEDNGVFTVTFVGTVENYMLHLYDHCVPLPTSAFSDS
jgi:hypothetical protein